ncbi:MAG: VWA domain-containing protein [Candidatus Omnitrophica bacterium]|nr:VWA domain-containing protein [Candidatus Omnitrophota bacterium]
MTEWGVPQNFIWLWAVPVLVIGFFFASWRKRRAMNAFGDPALVERLIASLDPARRLLKRVLILVSVSLVILALCQPHFRTKETLVERKGIDVVIALDVSKSMLARDIAPNRLEKAKLELATLVERLKQDRIGIVAFAGEAFIQCPLTLDKSAVKLFLSTVNPNLIPTPGTALGAAIQVAQQAFGDQEKGFKAVILLTDGEDQGSNPMQATAKAREAGIRIFTIGIGTGEGSTLPGDAAGEGFKKDSQGRPVLSKLDEPLLKAIARETGGVYYRSTRGEVEVEHLVYEIRQMVQKGLRTERSVEYEENYQVLLALALILLWTETALSERRGEEPTEKKAARLAVILLLVASPFFLGFKFYSALKNEEGNKHFKKGEIGKAKTQYLKALRSEPGLPPVAFNLGNAYYKEARYEDSLKTYRQAAEDPKDAHLQSKAFYNLGNTLYRRQEPDKAVEFYKQALRLDPKDEDAKYNLELLKKKEDQKKKEDPKKDQDKQKKQDQKDQKGQNQEPRGGQGQPEKKEEAQGEKSQDQQDLKGREEPKPMSPEPAGQKEDQKPASGSEGEEEKKKEPEKTPGQMRADQILDALENQEKKALRTSGQKNPVSSRKRTFERDW